MREEGASEFLGGVSIQLGIDAVSGQFDGPLDNWNADLELIAQNDLSNDEKEKLVRGDTIVKADAKELHCDRCGVHVQLK